MLNVILMENVNSMLNELNNLSGSYECTSGPPETILEGIECLDFLSTVIINCN